MLMVFNVKDAEASLSPEQLINPRSVLSDAVPVKRKTKHW
jgi:methionyl-tRNA synthetase